MRRTSAALCLASALLCAAGAPSVAGDVNVTVVTLQLPLEQEHTLQVDRATEYIVHFVPPAQQSQFPLRLWVRSGGGDVARPLLLTARQHSGATTWQLPYYSGESLLHEMERTLCPSRAGAAEQDDSDCAEGQEQRGEMSLHVASACARPFSVTLRLALDTAWRLERDSIAALTLTQAAPRVLYYEWEEEQTAVRAVLESEDVACATVAVQDAACPIVQSEEEVHGAALRLTMERSAAILLTRSRFPRGLYLAAWLGASDAACSGAEAAADEDAAADWLWDSALAPHAAPRTTPAPRRDKRIHIRLQESLSRRQYWVGASVTLAVFLLFYVAFAALVLLQRWPAWGRLVGPTAVLAEPPKTDEGGATDTAADTAADTVVNGRRTRTLSGATFDSSDNSDTDSEDEGATTATTASAAPSPAAEQAGVVVTERAAVTEQVAVTERAAVTEQTAVTEQAVVTEQAAVTATDAGVRPFGLPARLHVGALARRRARVLRARSDRYLYTLLTVAVFYALPVVQFVAAFQLMFNAFGELDLCYYNFLCAHPLGALADFNHVLSNLGYLLLGALLLLQLRRRRLRRERRPRHDDYGIPLHYGLLASLGAGMMVVALLSASYHVCPNRLNFQFDTAFMYVLAVLSMVKIYQSRHADINARAHATFAVLALLIALVVWGVLGGGALFWAVFTVVHVFSFLLLSLQIYYLGQFRLEKASLVQTARSLRAARPLYTPRLVALLVANAVNWAFAIYGLATRPADIASHLLSVLLCNVLLYMAFYMSMKLVVGERVRWYAWLWLGGAAAAWAPALYFFVSGSTDWSATPARSRHLNHECRVLAFYDSHDLWHALSAVALYLTFNAMLAWDDGLSSVRRTDIAVF